MSATNCLVINLQFHTEATYGDGKNCDNCGK